MNTPFGVAAHEQKGAFLLISVREMKKQNHPRIEKRESDEEWLERMKRGAEEDERKGRAQLAAMTPEERKRFREMSEQLHIKMQDGY